MPRMPLGVRIIAILYWIGAAFCAIGGLLMLVGSGFIAALVSQIPVIGVLGPSFFIALGLFALALAVVNTWVGIGLWKGRNWARIVALVFACLGLANQLFSLGNGKSSGIITLIIHGVIIWYLGFNKDIKKAFS